MRCILSPLIDPAFNLAAEESLFRNSDDDLLLLYINSPSVVVGKHQNALAEVDPWFLYENNIPVLRRLSGGGTVYHDLGNLNFSFHKTVDDPAKISFSVFTQPVAEALKKMGIPAEMNKRNDIIVDGFKVSGHAEHVFRKRVLSHGTLLFNTNTENLSKALRTIPGIYSGKGIKSIPSKVTNLSGFLKKPLSIHEFTNKLLSHFSGSNDSIQAFSVSETENVEKLANEKYRNWEWNYGYSPAYDFHKKGMLNHENPFTCKLHVEKGIITEAGIEGKKRPPWLLTIEKKLPGFRHEIETLKNFIEANARNTIPTKDTEALLQSLL
ncbi:MAG: lipoate--protein ligase [Prolixibacteraceae bacterium]|nr:lipoate--protein ligase [Prolixibacteraceae bacterium]